MADMHITRELLEAITRGEIPVRVLEDLIMEHLRPAPVRRRGAAGGTDGRHRARLRGPAPAGGHPEDERYGVRKSGSRSR